MRSSTGSERTSSQVSIYNYPDHLNPFSEDDNHKRLRFWNLSKRNDNRRRSFSMGNLREFWNLKSFSLKKKSSTLGIQKTSESPPVLRRSLEANSLHPGEQGYGNRRPYTNSLQNISTPGMRSSETNFRVVHSPQRSTISGGYLTPLSQRFHPNRSSQASLNSTNPFESDIDSDATDIGSVSLSGCRKSYRKKRRAPLAPIRDMLNKPSPSPVNEATTDTQSTALQAEQNKAIRSLAVEIEQFVHNSNESATIQIPKVVVEPSSRPESPKTEPDVSEQTIFAKVSKSSHEAVPDETVATVECTSKSDPVTEAVQLDKQNSKIVVSSVVFESQQQTEPKVPEHKFSPVAPKRSHASRTERSKLKSIEHTTAADQVKIVETTAVSGEHKIPIQTEITETCTKEIKIPNVEKLSTADQEPVNAPVQVVETSYITESPKTEPKTVNHVCLPNDHVTEINIPNLEHTKADQVTEHVQINQIVETSFVSNSPPTEDKVPEEICLPQAPTPSQVPDETKITNIAHTSTSTATVCQHLHIDSLNANGGNLKPISERKNLNNFTTVQKYAFKANNNTNNARHDEYLNKPLAIFENSERTERSEEDNAQPAKAKSVKEIIDSINRSQKLLKDSAAKGTTVYSTSLYSENNNNISPLSNQRSAQSPEISPNISAASSGAENSLELEKNYFQKSKINKTSFQYRESSPTTSNLDWNPLPKPKRINNGSSM